MIAVLVASLLAAASPSDVVYTADGGRITGTVLEDSPASGVTIQTPDGVVRRIERAQVSRIEFADGTVSTPSPTPARAPEAAPAPRPAEGPGPIDTIFFSGGGRVRGTVMEENARTGVTARLLDGSVRTYAVEEISRVEYADGTVSTPYPAPRAPAPAAASTPRPKVAEGLDTVYFLGGGRVRGTVIEEHPRTGVKVRLLDGSSQTYPRSELVRIEYSDGSVSRRKMPPATATVAPAVAPAPVVAAPVPPPGPPPPAFVPPPRPEQKPPIFPLYFSVGVGATFLGGDATRDTSMTSVLVSPQAHLSGEMGLRFNPAIAIGAYGDVGGSDPAPSIRAQCRAQGLDCFGMTAHVGVLLRHTWDPFSATSKWISVGTGWELGSVTFDPHDGGASQDLIRYSGPEYLRLGAGVDFRTNQALALGLYGSFAFGEYDRQVTASAAVPVGSTTPPVTASVERRMHTTALVGLRLTLFP